MGVSLIVLGCVGVLVHASWDRAAAGARAYVEPPPPLVWSARTPTSDWYDDGDEDEYIGDDLDLGGPEWAEDAEIAAIASAEDEDEDEDEDDDDDADDDNEGDEERVDDGDDDDVEIAARTRALVDQRVAQISAVADSEAVDTSWAPAAEVDIAEGIAAHGPPGTRLVSTRCRTTLCIAEFEIPPNAEAAMHMSWLAGAGLSRGLFVHGQVEADASGRTVAYLARDGYSLP
ncbi:hypothetical protein [Enhygromyxa salina]|uniref:Uncharacterized protein n=1 Tax=Enhygromyxa salina TaxID=215803 RepID=A0A2S9YVP3_9BACT|nr:hypothetical protein [Enhygromyxa salina]PRQ09153.1 hypothetical protein ENSA7_11430 [Enhygromyxa salina]